MKTNRLFVLSTLLTVSFAISAQTTFDAMKVYEEELNGTARYVGMGGAMSALGSDVSVIGHNPAGIGTYRQSDINLSVSFFGTSVNTDPLVTNKTPQTVNGRTYYSHNTKSEPLVALDNASAVLSGYMGDDSYLNFGFSYRRSLNMDRDLDYIDKFFVPDGSDPTKEYVVYREYKDRQRNKVNAFDFNLSCSLSEMLYLGWTVELLSTDAWSEGYFYDYYPAYGDADLEDKAYVVPDYADGGHDYTAADKMNSAKGTGWNMGFGLIVRPVPALRLGAAIKTPTWFKQTLEYSDYLYAFEDNQYTNEYGEVDPFKNSVDYKFTSPWRLNLSAGFTVAQTAIGFEYEKSFTQRTSLSIGNTKMVNQGAIDLQDYSTFKVGFEQNIDKISLRAGYNMTQSVYKDGAAIFLGDSEFNAGKQGDVGRIDFQVDRLGKRQNFTCGLGYCSEPDGDNTQFYIDVAYVHGLRNSVVNINEYIEDVDVNYNYQTDKVLLTFGWTF